MSAIRVPVSVLAGAALSIALFVGLWQLVSVPFAVQPLAEAKRIHFTHQRPPTAAINRREPQVPREPPVAQPTRPAISPGGGAGGVVAGYTPPRLTPPVERSRRPTSGMDGDAVPLVRMQPDYPPGAAARNTEGWVQVRFSVTTAGTVRDAVVVSSEPGTTFDDAALKAVARWRYNPRVVDGVAVERIGLETVFRFELE